MKKVTLLVALAALTTLGASAQQERLNFINETVSEASEPYKATKQSHVALDEAVNVAIKGGASLKATVTADFERPKEVYTMGLPMDKRGFLAILKFGPPHRTYTWTNTSIGATSYEWQYYDVAQSQEPLVSTETNLSYYCPWSSFPGPALTAKDGASSDVKTEMGVLNAGQTAYDIPPTFYNLGGESKFGTQGSEKDCGIMSYDAEGGSWMTGSELMYDKESAQGYDQNGVSVEWANVFVKNVPEAKSYKLTGFNNIIPAPAQAYSITRTWVWLVVNAAKATTLNVSILRMTPDNKITNDTVAYGTANIPAGPSEMIQFELLSKDADGFESNDPVNINFPIMISIHGFADNPDILSCAPVIGTGNAYPRGEQSNFERHCKFQFDVEKTDGTNETYFFNSPWVYGHEDPNLLTAITDFTYMVDAAFWWMKTENTAINFNKDGETKTLTIEAYGPSYSWFPEVEANGEDMSWLTIDKQDVNNPQGQFTGQVQVTATAAALPADKTGRVANVKFSYPGAEMIVEFSQGAAGVESVVTSATTVRTVNGNFEVATDAKSVKIYSAAGALVKTANVEGNTVINAQDLAHGMYILKFDNNCTVKAVK